MKVKLQEFLFFPNHRMVILDFKSPKYSKVSITLKNKNFLYPTLQGNKISLESSEYEKYYNTTGSSRSLISSEVQIEARCFFTPTFIERVTSLAKKGIEIACNFEQNNVYILVKAKKNMFELPVFTSLYKAKSLLYPMWEIKEVLSIIDTLQLDNQEG